VLPPLLRLRRFAVATKLERSFVSRARWVLPPAFLLCCVYTCYFYSTNKIKIFDSVGPSCVPWPYCLSRQVCMLPSSQGCLEHLGTPRRPHRQQAVNVCTAFTHLGCRRVVYMVAFTVWLAPAPFFLPCTNTRASVAQHTGDLVWTGMAEVFLVLTEVTPTPEGCTGRAA
jgi:hypothetical protein